ncbi:MAG TPA: glycosyltransferase family 4 protein [Croceibacterium sp.]
MRIVYPMLWARPGRKACQAQSLATVAALARRGCEVTVMLPQGAGDPELTAADLCAWFAVSGEFRVLQRPSRWAGERLHRTLLWLRQVFADPATRDADLLYSRIPAMLAMGGLAPLPFATDHYRPWPDELPAIRPLVGRTARDRDCLGLILHSRYAAEAYRRAGVPGDRMLVAHNGFDPPAERLDKATARAQLGLPPDRPIALYAGRVNAAKGLDVLLALADRRPEVLFVLVGSEGQGTIEAAAGQRSNVRIEPWAEPAALPAWLYAADVLVIPPSRAPLERFRNCVLPIKLFAYLAAGRPILAPEAPDTAELLRHGESAWLVAPDRPDAAAEGLDRLLGDPALAARLSAEALRLAEGLTWDRRAETIAGFLQARLAQRSLSASTLTPIDAAIAGAAQAPSAEGT